MAKRIQRNVARPSATTSASAAPVSEGGAKKRPRGKRVAAQAVTDFTIQLATLSGAGIPIVRALTILEGQTKPGPFKEVLGELVEDVAAGTPMSEAMAKHPRVFDRLYSSMVKAGEAGGVLDTILNRLATFREKAATIRAKIRGAMIYPAMIVVVAIVVVSLVITLVIPKFQEIFESFDVELPQVTLILLAISDTFVNYWYLVFGIPIGLLLLHGLLMSRGGKYRFTMHRLLLRIPVLGAVLSRYLIASFSRTFGTLIQAGVPHLDALAIVRETASNEVLHAAVEDIRRTVREGEGIAQPMGETGVFDDLVVNMVDVGEATGELDGMLIKVAEAYEVQVDRKVDALFKVLEPLILLIMAVFVGFIVVALFMPLMKIMNTLGGA